MKIKLSIVLFLSILFLLFLGGGIYYLLFENPDKYILNDFLLIIKIKNSKKFLYNTDKNENIYRLILYQKKFKKIYKTIYNIKTSLQGLSPTFKWLLNSNIHIVYLKNKKIYFIFNYKWKSYLIKEIFYLLEKFKSNTDYFKITSFYTNNKKVYNFYSKINKKNFYILIKNNLFFLIFNRNFISSLETNTNNVENNENYNFIRANINNNDNIQIYLNKKIKNRVFQLNMFGINFEDYSRKSIFHIFSDLIIKNDIKNTLSNQNNSILNDLQIIPDNVSFFASVSFNNSKIFYNNLIKILYKKESRKIINNIEKYTGISADELIFSWLDKKIILAVFNKNFLIYIKIKNRKKLNEIIKFKKSHYLTSPANIIYKKTKIYKLNLKFFYNILNKLFNSKVKMPYFFIFNDYLVFTYKIELLKNLIDKYENDELLLYPLIDYTDINRNFNNRPIYIYSTANFFEKKLKLDLINKNYKNLFSSIGFKNNGLKMDILLRKRMKYDFILLPYWPIKNNSRIISSPLIVKLYHKYKKRILIMDKKYHIKIYNIFGELIRNISFSHYKNKIKKILSLSYFNNEYYLIFLLKNNNILKYSLKKSKVSIVSNQKNSVILLYDINNDNKPEIIGYNNENHIFFIKDLRGNIIFIKEIKEINVNNILLTKSDNIIYLILKNRNKIIVYNFNNKVLKRENSYKSEKVIDYINILNYNNKKYISILSKNGYFSLLTINGEILQNFPLKLQGKFLNPPSVINYNNGDLIFLISKYGKCYFLNRYGKIEKKLNIYIRISPFKKIYIEKFAKDSPPFLLIPSRRNIYIITIHGNIIKKIKSNFLPLIEDINEDNIKDIITTYNNKIYIYTLK